MSGYPSFSKLVDCRQHDDGAELFLVEGDSASASVVNIRDPSFQAVLPMQGKPMNALHASVQRVVANPWYVSLIAALGAGWGQSFDLKRLRFGRVLLLMDPDADGIHCGVLLQMFFYRWMRPFLDAGKLHVVWAPLAEIHVANEAEPIFAYTDPHLRSRREELRARGAQILSTDYYRGLASIPPARLAESCVAPVSRTSVKILRADVVAAMRVFGSDTDPTPSAQLELFGDS